MNKAKAAVGQRSESFISILGEDVPQSEDLFELVKSTETARFSEDVGYDINLLVQTSRRILASDEAANDSIVAVFAGELTTDLGVSYRSSEEVATETAPWLPASKTAPANQLIEISCSGIDVTLLTLDSNDRLVRVTAHDGSLSPTVYESDFVFSIEKYRAWSEVYPYSYSDSQDNPNIFYTSTNGLGISQPKSTKTVFILDTQLQQLSPNLIRSGDELIGLNARVAVAPSINWLYKATRALDSNYLPPQAWISTVVSESSNGTLQMVADRVEQTLKQYNIPLNTDAEIPNNMQSAELAIVAAHGGLNAEDRFFKSVSDDGTLKMSSTTLSRALSNVGVAVLFICSGGRFDKHPLAHTTIALPKELLDRGCSAVVGSPWPLDARVPSHWLPTFLESWNAGDSLIDATWKANKTVETAMGNSLEYRLAMTVYGNPLIKRKDW